MDPGRFLEIKLAFGSDSFKIGYNQNLSIEELKSIIAKEFSLNPEELELIYAGKVLSNKKKTVLHYDIPKNKTLLLCIRKPGTAPYVQEEEEEEDVEILKRNKYENKENDEDIAQQRRPTFFDQRKENYDKMRRKMKIYVEMPTNKYIKILVDPKDSIDDLKLLIEDLEGVPIAHQKLIFQNKALEDHITLEKYGLEENDAIELIIRKSERQKIQVHVKMRNGKKITLNIDQEESVKKVEAIIREQEGSVAKGCSLTFENGKELEGNKSLAYYNVNKYTVLYFM